ncbi:MAG: hypothetical protein OXI66_15025, partial [Boseongicola sp.]|nr:hypothetical protein [Boseongicola sp.]
MNDDDLDKLKAAMRAATPVPDDANKAANLALARKSFERFQGTTGALRQTPDGPETGLARELRMMLNFLSNRVALAATTAIVAAGAVILLPMGDALDPPQMPGDSGSVAPVPMLDRPAEANASLKVRSASTERHLRAQSTETALEGGDIFAESIGGVPFEHLI